MGFGGPVIKEGLILVISIVTLQNYFGDLGEVCGKYPGWVKVPGPFDICHFFIQLTILFTFIEIYGFWGPVIKEGLILVISIVTQTWGQMQMHLHLNAFKYFFGSICICI